MIKNLSAINTNSEEGRLLISALTMLTTTERVSFMKGELAGTKLEPDEMLKYVGSLSDEIYKDALKIPEPEDQERPTFQKALTTLVNRYSKENGSNTPDFILGSFLRKVLEAYDETLRERDSWFDLDVWNRGLDQTEGVKLIAAERQRQIQEEGWTEKHDAMHAKGQLAEAGAYYALTHEQRVWMDNNEKFTSANDGKGTSIWPWEPHWFKPSPDNRVRELQKAGALIAAEIDRLLRKQKKDQGSEVHGSAAKEDQSGSWRL